jgi:hypothetical protein
VTGPLPRGSMLVDPHDAALLAWAAGEALRGMRAAGRTLPSELVRLYDTLHAVVGGSANVPAQPAPAMPPSG